MDFLTVCLVVAAGWILLFAVIALYETFMGGYRTPVEWWKREILRH